MLQNTNSDEQVYESLIEKLPWTAPIYLPTDAVPLEQRIEGMKRVVDLHHNKLQNIYKPRLQALRDRYKGQRRAFIIGNGPSLNRTNLSWLKDEVTFCTNGFFLKFQDLDWRPTFHVVEDHLVAEDRAEEINSLSGMTKLYPAYLGYCLTPDENTIFFNHRARKSYPHGFDFSTNASDITYTGCTVTFTCLQLAHYLGFREIFLVGVDADYSIPDDASESSAYGTGVLDMPSDDPNHFHPDYFGKGKRWHDPQVDKMLEAYEEARRTVEADGGKIYNATVGGKLEVFPRRRFDQLFPGKGAATDIPRLLVIDMTPVGGITATGALKQTLLDGWPPELCMHISADGYPGFVCQGGPVAPHEPAARYKTVTDAARLAELYRPDLILYRPLPEKPTLHALALDITERTHAPIATWIMDDWLARLEDTAPDQHAYWIDEMKALAARASLNLSISEAMSKAMKARLGQSFTAFANAVSPEEWPEPDFEDRDGPVILRYSGGLAQDMTLDTLLNVAAAVEAAGDTRNIRFEVNTRRHWFEMFGDRFKPFRRTSISVSELERDDYVEWLRRADILLLAYNFDEDSLRYVRHSMANKLPELLASGKPVLAVGPAGQASIDLLREAKLGARVVQKGSRRIQTQLEALTASVEKRREIGAAGRAYALEHLSLETIRPRFQAALRTAARPAKADEAPAPYKEIHDLVLQGQSDHVGDAGAATVPRIERMAGFLKGWRGAVGAAVMLALLLPAFVLGGQSGWVGKLLLLAPPVAGGIIIVMLAYLYTVFMDNIRLLEHRLEALEKRPPGRGK